MKYIILAIVVLCVGILSVSASADNLIENLEIWLAFYGPPEDITHNGEVNVDDISSLVNEYGSTGPPGWIREDINKDGEVGVDDIALLVNKYGMKWIIQN